MSKLYTSYPAMQPQLKYEMILPQNAIIYYIQTYLILH